MEFSMLAVIIITSLISAMLSLGAKLIYDGIKAKKNGTTSTNGSQQVSVNLALLAKDVDFNNKKLSEIVSNVNRLVELSIATKEQVHIHLTDLKTTTAEQTNAFRMLVSALTAAMAKWESKL